MVAKKPVNIRLWPDLWDRVQRVAEKRGRPITWVVEKALEEYCEREEKE